MSVLFVVIVLCGVVGSLPGSAMTRAADYVLIPISGILGLDQKWNMFAPNPPRRDERLEVVVTMADGDKRTWSIDQYRSLLPPVNWDRWNKFESHIIDTKQQHAAFANWVVHEVTRPNEKPVRVQIILLTESLSPPGKDDPITKEKKVIYNKKLTGRK